MYMKISKNRFFAEKIVEIWDFRRTFGWLCQEMMIFIYIASLEHTYLVKYLWNGQNKNHGISPTPSTIIFDDPHTQTTPQISPHIHQKMRKRCKNNYIETFGAVYWATTPLPPSEEEGLKREIVRKGVRNRSLTNSRRFYGKNVKLGKRNLFLTENWLSRNGMWCAADNYNYKCHTCAKRFLDSKFN